MKHIHLLNILGNLIMISVMNKRHSHRMRILHWKQLDGVQRFWKKFLRLPKAAFYLIKNTGKIVNIIVILNSCFLCEYLLKYNLFLWSKLYYQHHYCSLQCHMIFRNHSNMLICCSRNISDYYQCLETVVLHNISVETVIQLIFQDSQMNRKFKRTAFIWNRNLCNIINVFTVTFDQFNASLMNKSNNSFQSLEQ